MFKIGEKVRMLHDIHEGIVLKVKDKGIVEIETTDGFVLPVLERELVRIHGMEKEEKPTQRKADNGITPRNQVVKESLSIGVEKVSMERYRLYLINQTKTDLVGVLNFISKGEPKNYTKVSVEKGEFLAILGQFEMTNSEGWTKLELQLIPYKEGQHSQKPITAKIHLKQSKIVMSDSIIPLVNKPGALFELNLKLDEEATDVVSENISKNKSKLDELEIDLHANTLGLKADTLDFLNLQYEEFLKAFDRCIHESIPKLIVIHGVGKGLLKNKIHQFLATNEQIQLFKDARKEKFGYGATEITFH